MLAIWHPTLDIEYTSTSEAGIIARADPVLRSLNIVKKLADIPTGNMYNDVDPETSMKQAIVLYNKTKAEIWIFSDGEGKPMTRKRNFSKLQEGARWKILEALWNVSDAMGNISVLKGGNVPPANVRLCDAWLYVITKISSPRKRFLLWPFDFTSTGDVRRDRVPLSPCVWIVHEDVAYYPIYQGWYVLGGAVARDSRQWLIDWTENDPTKRYEFEFGRVAVPTRAIHDVAMTFQSGTDYMPVVNCSGRTGALDTYNGEDPIDWNDKKFPIVQVFMRDMYVAHARDLTKRALTTVRQEKKVKYLLRHYVGDKFDEKGNPLDPKMTLSGNSYLVGKKNGLDPDLEDPESESDDEEDADADADLDDEMDLVGDVSEVARPQEAPIAEQAANALETGNAVNAEFDENAMWSFVTWSPEQELEIPYFSEESSTQPTVSPTEAEPSNAMPSEAQLDLSMPDTMVLNPLSTQAMTTNAITTQPMLTDTATTQPPALEPAAVEAFLSQCSSLTSLDSTFTDLLSSDPSVAELLAARMLSDEPQPTEAMAIDPPQPTAFSNEVTASGPTNPLMNSIAAVIRNAKKKEIAHQKAIKALQANSPLNACIGTVSNLIATMGNEGQGGFDPRQTAIEMIATAFNEVDQVMKDVDEGDCI